MSDECILIYKVHGSTREMECETLDDAKEAIIDLISCNAGSPQEVRTKDGLVLMDMKAIDDYYLSAP